QAAGIDRLLPHLIIAVIRRIAPRRVVVIAGVSIVGVGIAVRIGIVAVRIITVWIHPRVGIGARIGIIIRSRLRRIARWAIGVRPHIASGIGVADRHPETHLCICW